MFNPGPDPLILAGLRVPFAEADAVRRAFAWAVAEHAGQVRKDDSLLIDHVLSVARNMQRYVTDEDLPLMLTAALLHDIVENTRVSLDDVEARFGSQVALLVDAVTNREGESAADSAYRARDTGREALLLRLCDRLDGIRRSPGRPLDNARKFLDSSRTVHLKLAEEQFPHIAEAMREALESAETALG